MYMEASHSMIYTISHLLEGGDLFLSSSLLLLSYIYGSHNNTGTHYTSHRPSLLYDLLVYCICSIKNILPDHSSHQHR